MSRVLVSQSAKALLGAPPVEVSALEYGPSPDGLDRDLVFGFFWRFAVFECALKHEGFLRAARDHSAQPDWTRFSGEINGAFTQGASSELLDAVTVLTASPPQRQVVRDGRLGWEVISRRPGQSDEDYVLKLVRTVRNNLFHGGKHPVDRIQRVERDRALLVASLTVIDECFQLHPGIRPWGEAA